MTIERKIKVEMEIWCTHPDEFENLMLHLQVAMRRGEFSMYENGKSGGYGFEIKPEQFDETKFRKALGFKKDEV